MERQHERKQNDRGKTCHEVGHELGTVHPTFLFAFIAFIMKYFNVVFSHSSDCLYLNLYDTKCEEMKCI